MAESVIYSDTDKRIYRDASTGLTRYDWINPPARPLFVDTADFTNNANPLQAAIDKAISANRAVVMSSPLSVPDTVSVTAPVHVFGAHRGITLTAGGADFNVIELDANCDGSTFENFTIIGGAEDDSTTQFGIFSVDAGGPDSVTIRCVDTRSAGVRALNNFVKAYRVSDWLVTGCDVRHLIGTDLTNTGYGVLTGRSTRISVVDCRFIGGAFGLPMGRHGVYMTVGTCDSLVSNVLVSGFQRSGIILKSGPGVDISCDRNIIEACQVVDGGAGITDQAGIAINGQAQRNRIDGCVVDNWDGWGIDILPGDSLYVGPEQLQDNVIQGCTITRTTLAGIHLQSTNRSLLRGNLLRDVALSSSPTSSGISVRGNGAFGQGDDVGTRIMDNDFGGVVGRYSIEISSIGDVPPSGFVVERNNVVAGTHGTITTPA